MVPDAFLARPALNPKYQPTNTHMFISSCMIWPNINGACRHPHVFLAGVSLMTSVEKHLSSGCGKKRVGQNAREKGYGQEPFLAGPGFAVHVSPFPLKMTPTTSAL